MQSCVEDTAESLSVCCSIEGDNDCAAWQCPASKLEARQSGDNRLEGLTKQVQNENRMKNRPSARLLIQIVCVCVVEHY